MYTVKNNTNFLFGIMDIFWIRGKQNIFLKTKYMVLYIRRNRQSHPSSTHAASTFNN